MNNPPFPVVDDTTASMLLDWYTEQGQEDVGQDIRERVFYCPGYFTSWVGTQTSLGTDIRKTATSNRFSPSNIPIYGTFATTRILDDDHDNDGTITRTNYDWSRSTVTEFSNPDPAIVYCKTRCSFSRDLGPNDD